MRIIRSSEAQGDLFEIWYYISRNNLNAANELQGKFEKKFRFLSENPLAGRSCDGFGLGLRYIIEGNYTIFYKIVPNDTLAIVNVIHTSRDINRIF